MTNKRVRKLQYHYEQFLADKCTTGKKTILEKLRKQANKYSGNRGQTIIEKIKYIETTYPEVLI